MALNQALARTLVEPDAVELDKIEVEEGGEAMEAARAEAEARERQGKLFNGLRFFLDGRCPGSRLCSCCGPSVARSAGTLLLLLAPLLLPQILPSPIRY